MSAKREKPYPNRDQRGFNASSVQRWLSGRRMLLFVGVTVLVVAGGLAVSYWWHSGRPSSPSPAPAAQREAALPAGSGGIPMAKPKRSSDEEFIARMSHGNELLMQGKPAEAIEVFTQALQLKPEDEDVHYNLALALTRVGKTNEAMEQYEQALKILPGYSEAHNNLGNLLMRAGRTEDAIQHFEQAIKSMPDYALAHNSLGTALQKIGRTNDAMVHFRQAVRLNSDYWQAHFNLGMSFLQQGELDEARKELDTVIRLQPGFQPAKAVLAEIQDRQSTAAQPKP